MGKLVRDNIPAIIEAAGRAAEVRTLSEKDFRLSLHEKLAEEVAELRDARSAQEVLEEAADVVEAIRAIAGIYGRDFDEVIRAADAKRKTHGGFNARLYLESTSEDGESPTAFMADEFLEPLESGPLYRFADWPNPEVPVVAAGVYTVWDGDTFVYVGFAGMKLRAEDMTNAKNLKKAKGLRDRLDHHASGARSGDQFCVYICDRFVLSALTEDERMKIHEGDMRLLNVKTRQHIRERYHYRFVLTPDGKTARGLEKVVQQGALSAGKPLLNPR